MLAAVSETPNDALELVREKLSLERECQALTTKKQALKAAVMQKDLKEMRRVLERLSMVDADGVVLDKERVAAVITAGDELVMTEMMYDGVLKNLTPRQIAVMITVFVCDEGGKDKPDIIEDLAGRWEAGEGHFRENRGGPA